MIVNDEGELVELPPLEKAELPLSGTKPELMAYEVWNNVFVPGAAADNVYDIWTWEGRVGDIAQLFKVSQPYFQQTIGHLTRMGCIKSLRRGANKTPSLIQLIRPPSVALWESENTHVGSVAKDITAQQFRDIRARLDKIELVLQALTKRSDNGNATGS